MLIQVYCSDVAINEGKKKTGKKQTNKNTNKIAEFSFLS